MPLLQDASMNDWFWISGHWHGHALKVPTPSPQANRAKMWRSALERPEHTEQKRGVALLAAWADMQWLPESERGVRIR